MSDTLQLDSAQLVAFQQDPRYDYDRELMGGSQNLLEWISEVITKWINDTFNVVLDNDFTYYLLIFVGVLVLAFLGWLWWYKRPKLFIKGDSKDALDYDVEEDTIYGVNFEADIKQALLASDFRQAVRLRYLQTLKYLEDAGKIEWQPSKTPSQYVRQVSMPAFSTLSRHFINVRYGNYEVTAELYEEVKALQDEIMKGGGSHE